ncbi:MAG: hypothetical protein ACTS3F_11125 [Phycisphaerales bacterium]
MAILRPAPGESFTIRRQILKFFGAAFHIYGAEGELVGYCKQKAWRLREDLRIYTDESMARELMAISARHVIDFAATYDIRRGDGSVVGSIRRRGLSSAFARDSWEVFGPSGESLARLEEDSLSAGLARRLIPGVAFISPQVHELRSVGDGSLIATLRTRFNPFVHKMGVSIEADHPELDELAVLGMGCVILAIEGRQTDG